MEKLLDTLNNLTPVLIIGSLAIFMTLEKYLPYFEHGMGRGKQRWHNIGMIAIAFLINAVVGSLIAIPIIWSQENNFGLMHRILGQSTLAIVLGIFLIDLSGYLLQVIMHKIPALWRIHRIHHADTEMDATSSLRLHPFELILQLAVQAVLLPLLGVSIASFIFYFTLALPWFVLNHSNIKFPYWFERIGSLIMSTPDWHRVHHSSFQPETDSHYGCLFSIWDRLFGTGGKVNVEKIQFGLDKFRGPGDQSVWQLLKMPFKK